MLTLLKDKNKNHKQETTSKRKIAITGTLTDVLRPGFPAVCLYQGSLIRTSTVQAILEASADHVQFETLNSIYTISYNGQPRESFRVIA